MKAISQSILFDGLFIDCYSRAALNIREFFVASFGHYLFNRALILIT
jgi:hypothetical protein